MSRLALYYLQPLFDCVFESIPLSRCGKETRQLSDHEQPPRRTRITRVHGCFVGMLWDVGVDSSVSFRRTRWTRATESSTLPLMGEQWLLIRHNPRLLGPGRG